MLLHNENGTQINHMVHSDSIMRNSNAADNSTVINHNTQGYSSIQPGTKLCGVYEVIEKLNVLTGEADLYVCSFAARNYVAKVYRRKAAIKPEVSDRLAQIRSLFVARVFAVGSYDGFPVEILPYYSNGSLAGKQFTFDQLKYEIIPSINEGLHILHENGIIHKDLKPSNIMLNNDGKTAAIIDFGISSLLENGSTVLLTKTGLTPEYSAPETFRNLFLSESDYYSLGVTIFELYCGHAPYANMSQEEIVRFVSLQKLPIPNDMEMELQDLIAALTYSDITNRQNKTNPNRRWGYEEVLNWCNDIPQAIPGRATVDVNDGNSNAYAISDRFAIDERYIQDAPSKYSARKQGDMQPYHFGGKIITETSTLANELNEHWEEAKKHLFRGFLLSHFKNGSNAEITSGLMDLEEEADSGDPDLILYKCLHLLNPLERMLLWKGRKFRDLGDVGHKYLEAIRNQNTEFLSIVDELLTKGILSLYLSNIEPSAKEHIQALEAAESQSRVVDEDTTSCLRHRYQIAYMLSDVKDFAIDEQRFDRVDDLIDYLLLTFNKSHDMFDKLCSSMLHAGNRLDVQLECWLIANGKGKAIKSWQAGKHFIRQNPEPTIQRRISFVQALRDLQYDE